MSLQQHEQQEVVFWKPSIQVYKVVPTEKQFNSFRNSKVYGLWINEKKVFNSVLDQYSVEGFSHMDISKLNGFAKKGKSYSYQVNLMTNNYYEAFRVRTIADKSNKMAFQVPQPQKR